MNIYDFKDAAIKALNNNRFPDAPYVDAGISIAIGVISDMDAPEDNLGHWELFEDCANAGVYCSICHKKVYTEMYANQKCLSKFCPNCGHKMDTKNFYWKGTVK